MGKLSTGEHFVIAAVADTHAIIWYIFADRRLSETARTTIEQIAAEGNQVAFSSITLAEIVYLSERGRIATETLEWLLREVDQEDSVLIEVPFDRHIAQALSQVERSQVPDLPDRMIAATALYLGVLLISRDHQIQLSDVETIW
ncbi:type II toxin-antitoxin system VapC family toxin [Kovacikia minuta CCNUW1]|uniref:type II toxin-antitoxin system VapC family toxin n=1 Tax=Kovacikia minuta TaxID=2931930 RepID=UPI001CCE7EAC|nr:type II toxin-antitoxin system VapC family toxin [Kovacikia minuta]UBF27238.1 type II toxin-antitoxin system VapC family toxin [Kovacikia minuta CCNUW1]